MTWNFLDESIFRGTIALSFFKLQNWRFKVIVEYDANFILFLFFCLHSVGGCCEILEIENYEQVGPLLQWLTFCLQSRPFTFDHEKLALNESFALKCRQVHIHDFTCFFPVVLLYFMYWVELLARDWCKISNRWRLLIDFHQLRTIPRASTSERRIDSLRCLITWTSGRHFFGENLRDRVLFSMAFTQQTHPTFLFDHWTATNMLQELVNSFGTRDIPNILAPTSRRLFAFRRFKV